MIIIISNNCFHPLYRWDPLIAILWNVWISYFCSGPRTSWRLCHTSMWRWRPTTLLLHLSSERFLNRWMDGWMDGLVDSSICLQEGLWMDGWMDWLTDWLVGWSIDWMVDLIDWFRSDWFMVVCLVGCLLDFGWLICCLVG